MRTLPEKEAVQAMCFVEKLVVCLDQIGSTYQDNKAEQAAALSYMFEANKVFKEASVVRMILSNMFSYELEGEEDQSEVEKLCADIAYYKLPSPEELTEWLSNK
ncbi:hypothetical protein [Hymenobacter crusticola]|uniref:Uncharacterized protein n=1 Tax=Hymenobacter crusticola TaxID=1770526 RepID=A0A243WK26_9BACT|nr:hypothetical protein [Hymenobacter crusticola]OUJ75970.1 hypothetical protein BXP70_01420 [Hymenobacter crusticola]